MQQKIVALQQKDGRDHGDMESHIKVFAELTITEIIKENGKVAGTYGYWRESGAEVLFEAPAVIIATDGVGKTFKITSNSWEGTGDGHALALKAGANLVDMEFLQFHPTGMVWPPSVRGILVTESVRGEGGILTNNLGERFMFKYIPDVFKDKYADNETEADGWYIDQDNNRRPPELLPRDEVARAINSEVKAGRGSEHGGVFLDVSKRISAEIIKKRLPSMWHQFYELAGVDITKEAMEVGPTCHYVMGGVEVESHYTADITRTLPVTGKFTAAQKQIYMIVYRAQQAGIAAVKPGNRFKDFHAACMEEIAKGASELGVLPMSPEESLKPENGLHRRWMFHGSGHHLGIDVHDCAQARKDQYADAILEPGMILTVEPGFYIQPDDELFPPEFRGVGVRIEDDVVVTETGCRVMSSGLPRHPDEIEAWMAKLLNYPIVI